MDARHFEQGYLAAQMRLSADHPGLYSKAHRAGYAARHGRRADHIHRRSRPGAVAHLGPAQAGGRHTRPPATMTPGGSAMNLCTVLDSHNAPDLVLSIAVCHAGPRCLQDRGFAALWR